MTANLPTSDANSFSSDVISSIIRTYMTSQLKTTDVDLTCKISSVFPTPDILKVYIVMPSINMNVSRSNYPSRWCGSLGESPPDGSERWSPTV